MIVVVGSRHDPVAVELVRQWPGAALCGADDLMGSGWRWPARVCSGSDERRWVVNGDVVLDAEVTGVYVRRSAVYPDELTSTHSDDRAYLASEATAFLVYVLATTGAVVVNPVGDGTLVAPALRPELWMRVAAGLGVPVSPLRLSSDVSPPPGGSESEPTSLVEVVAGEALTTGYLASASVAVVGALGLQWAAVRFDRSGHLCGLTSSSAPSTEAADRLGVLLSDRGRLT